MIKFKAAVLLGVTVCASAGDQGSSDNEKDGKVHADFPSFSSFVLACGGTKLSVVNGAIISKVVWHGSMSSAAGGVGQASVNKQPKAPVNISTTGAFF